VRRDDDRTRLEQRRVGARLGGETVDAGAADAALLDGQRERVLVDQPAAGGVDDPDAGLDQLQLALADQADRLRRLGQVDRDEVALAQQVVER
jgi:hypothetical protein